MLGVEQVTVDGAVIRTVVKTTADGQFAVGRELRRRLAEALENSGITAQIAAARIYPGLPTRPLPERRDRSGRRHLTQPPTTVRPMSGVASRRGPSGIVRSFSRGGDDRSVRPS